MPELPEVETVRRGLAPAMEGARFTKVEVRHRGLRWPIAEGLRKAADRARPSKGSAGGRNICWRICRRATCW